MTANWEIFYYIYPKNEANKNDFEKTLYEKLFVKLFFFTFAKI